MDSTTNKNEYSITAKEVDLWYEQGKPMEVQALKNISLEIKKGDYVAFFGPSGCGKTTLLYAIAGIDHYQHGQILINNKDLTGLTNQDLAYFRQTDIGIVFQQFNLLPSLTVLQNVALPMTFRGFSSKDAEVEARKLIDRLNLGAYVKRYPYELSGGQQQRVAIARAIANDPPLIIADEPLGNLDSVNAKNVLTFLKELNEKDGRTIIMVTHEAWSLQDVKTIFYMKDGTITGKSSTDDASIQDAIKEHLYKEIGGASKKADGGNATDVDIFARILSNFLLRGFSMTETSRFEELVKERLNNKIDAQAFYDSVRKPVEAGGIGLWKDKVKRVVEYVEESIEKKKNLQDILKMLEEKPEMPLDDEVRVVRAWVLEDYDAEKLDHGRIASLDQAISDRLRGFITQEQFVKLLTHPAHSFGVGLSERTALIFAQRIESLLGENATPSPSKDQTQSPGDALVNQTNIQTASTVAPTSSPSTE